MKLGGVRNIRDRSLPRTVEASGLWPGKIVTELAPFEAFWEAEPEHQDYLERIPNGYTCHFVRSGWKLPHRATAPRARDKEDLDNALERKRSPIFRRSAIIG